MRVVIALLVSLAVLRAQVPQPTDVEGWKKYGVELFRAGKYREAAEAFGQASMIDPRDRDALLYLATTHTQLYVPGNQAPENLALANRAEQEFKYVLEIDPNDKIALASLTSLNYSQAGLIPFDGRLRKVEEAREWNRRLLALDPSNREAHYWAGALVWSAFYPALMDARWSVNMTPQKPGPLPPSASKIDLIAKFGSMVDDGISHLRSAIEIDPHYSDAMAYLNLLIRERADFRDTPEEYERDVAEADIWVGRALEAKKLQAQNLPIPSAISPPPANVPPQNTSTPQRIRVDGNVQQANLIHSVDPVCPPLATQAKIRGIVKFSLVVEKTGSLKDIQLISGHPLLVSAALEAVKQREYRPTLLNGEPVEVITTVDVNMPCGQ
jgi:tetratricopeptide (TPR) repeat protein